MVCPDTPALVTFVSMFHADFGGTYAEPSSSADSFSAAVCPARVCFRPTSPRPGHDLAARLTTGSTRFGVFPCIVPGCGPTGRRRIFHRQVAVYDAVSATAHASNHITHPEDGGGIAQARFVDKGRVPPAHKHSRQQGCQTMSTGLCNQFICRPTRLARLSDDPTRALLFSHSAERIRDLTLLLDAVSQPLRDLPCSPLSQSNPHLQSTKCDHLDSVLWIRARRSPAQITACLVHGGVLLPALGADVQAPVWPVESSLA
ncbi:hypothetical protein NUW54_g6345 [Trametes sanguinea]|uniref:Uncharacterized protein n=1 Tax=Trametes sanguinea TaxID=158606 RepID=A0ACC1PSI1_9APHY|nr:hypothetical protein NUW54_g6345 [Trametes sanguinea]